MRGHDTMTVVKLLLEERMIDDRNRAMKAKDVVVERTLIGRAMDRICLGTVINLLVADGPDTPERRLDLETLLRRGGSVTNRHGSYRVAPSQVVSDWTPTPEKATNP